MTLHKLYTNKLIADAIADATGYAYAGRVGSAGIPVVTHLATDLADTLAGPDCTITGVVCGHCSEDWEEKTRHADIDHVRQCAAASHSAAFDAWCEAPLVRAGVL